MANLEPYTSTYTDVDGSIMDADDLVNEFYRVAYYLNLWGGVVDAIGRDEETEVYVEIVEGELAEILPANGYIQRLEVAADVDTFEVAIRDHTEGAPFRVYIIIRCLNKDTRFTVSAPSGNSHTFGVNRTTYMPSQVIADGFYAASILCTYGSEDGVMVQIHAANPEETEVTENDVLQLVAQ
jgi:hypothetical protein